MEQLQMTKEIIAKEKLSIEDINRRIAIYKEQFVDKRIVELFIIDIAINELIDEYQENRRLEHEDNKSTFSN